MINVKFSKKVFTACFSFVPYSFLFHFMTVPGCHVETPGRLCCVRDPRPWDCQCYFGLCRGSQSHSDLYFSYFLITGAWPTCFHFTLCRGWLLPCQFFLALSSKTVAVHCCSLRALERKLSASCAAFSCGVPSTQRLRYKHVHFTRGSSTKTDVSQETREQTRTFHKRLRY